MRYLRFTEHENVGLELGCTQTGKPYGKPMSVPRPLIDNGHKMASALPTDASEDLQLSQRNNGSEPATARDRSLQSTLKGKFTARAD